MNVLITGGAGFIGSHLVDLHGIGWTWILNIRACRVRNIGVNNENYNRLEIGASITRRF